MIPEQRILLVHAHPDDESSQSAATMARYVAAGAQVSLVTCTLGERGEILIPEWAHFTPAELGNHRQEEIAEALKVVGVTDHIYLGGAGRYHDSGMTHDENGQIVPPPDMPDNAFWKADLLEASDLLVEVIRSRRPQVVITYDPYGNYGHPDHIQAHRVTMYAAALAAVSSHRPELGEAWQIARMLWIRHSMAHWEEAYAIARERGIDPWPDQEEPPRHFQFDQNQIAAIVETAPWFDACRRALGAHRSQVDPNQPFWQFRAIMQELPGAGEGYLLAAGQPFPAGSAPATDLFEGIGSAN